MDRCCKCGCGTPVTSTFVKGHNRRKPTPSVVPTLCACGCGQFTSIWRGRPRRYRAGHQARGSNNSRFGATISQETRAKIGKGNQRAAIEGRNPKTIAGWKHSESSRRKMSEAHAKSPRTGAKNPFYGKKHSAESKAKMLAWRSKAPVLPSTPERLVHEELRRRGIDFHAEYAVGVFRVDIFLPSRNLVIFVDGCYWHACPTHHPGKKRPQSDRTRIPYLTKAGYKVAILWEHEIEENVTKAIASIFAGLVPPISPAL